MPDDSASILDALSGGSQSSGTMVAVPSRQPQLPANVWSHAPPAIPEIINSKPGPVELWHALRRRYLVATGLGLFTGVLLAALVWFLVPIKFEVVALLRVLSTRPSVMKDGPSAYDSDYPIYKRTQAALFKSNDVLQAALRKPEIRRLKIIQEHKDNLLDFLSNQIQVEYPNESEIMRVSMKGDRPDELKTIVNAVKDSYMEEIVTKERMERLGQKDLLNRLYLNNRKEINENLEVLYKLYKDHKTPNDTSARVRLDREIKDLDNIAHKRTELQTSIADVQMRMLLLKTRADNAGELQPPDWLIEHQLSTDPQIAAIQKDLADIGDVLKESERRTKNPNSPGLGRWREKARSLEEKLEARREELRPVLVQMFKYSQQGNEVPIEFLPVMQTELDAYEEALKVANDQFEKQMAKIQELDKASSEIETRTEQLAVLKDVTQTMGAELKKIEIDLNENARGRIQSIEDATVPSGNDALKKYVATAFSGLLGFASVLFIVAILEFQSRRLNSEREVREGLGIRVIGHLPSLSGRAWRKLGDASSDMGAHLQSLLTESVDSIRAILLHSNGANPPRVVMVSSSDTQEGKTTVASQLAASLARAGRRTLLLDADLRNPTAHVVFGLPLGPGFAEVLRGDAEREATVYATPAPNLWLMPAGQYDATAVQAISGEALVNLVKSLKEQYDFVIVDAPPVLKVADPLILGQCVDAAVLSVRRDVSRIPKIYEACECLRSVGVKVLGAIVNGVNEKPMKRSAPIHV